MEETPDMKALVTGGAGFIGSHLVDALVLQGHEVTVVDNLDPWVHSCIPSYLNPEARYVFTDVRDVRTEVERVDIIYHLAAVTSVPQSEADIGKCISANVSGTANLLDAVTPDKRLVLASSRAVYGEGRYLCAECGDVYPLPRHQGVWDVDCPTCGRHITPVGTDESSVLHPASVYALSKRMQEDLCLHASKVKGFPLTVLRYFNVYGSRQSLSNPYVGILSIFISRLLQGKPIEVYEDGGMKRDFVYVQDAVDATLLDRVGTFNVGTGSPVTVLEVARLLTSKLGGSLEITGASRTGDVRHCFSSPSSTSTTPLSDGIDHLIKWSRTQ
jgi:dTDP-L-rhamnose 4-epimerase